nr:unnamed protein product [Digitaria exilis]
MCGRARCTLSAAQAARAFGFPTTTAAAAGGSGGGAGDAPAVRTLDLDRFRPSYNVSPGAYLPVGTLRAHTATGGDGGRGDGGVEPVIQCMKWGLVPSFTGKNEKPDHFRMYYLTFASREIIHTFTILTTRASTSLKWLHDRMPVILGDNASVNIWLNDASVKLEEITAPYEGADLVWYPVTPAMGKTSFDGPECIKEMHTGPREKPISNFFTKKSSAEDQSLKPEKITLECAKTHASRASKVECDEAVENQPDDVNRQQPEDKQNTSSIVKDEPVSLEHQVFGKPQSIKDEDIMTSTDITIEKRDDSGIKRKIEDTEVKSEMIENSVWSHSQPTTTKKGKGAPSDGQASLLSYFARM